MMVFKNYIVNATLSGIVEIDILQITVHDPQAEYKIFEYLILISFHQQHICEKRDTWRIWGMVSKPTHSGTILQCELLTAHRGRRLFPSAGSGSQCGGVSLLAITFFSFERSYDTPIKTQPGTHGACDLAEPLQMYPTLNTIVFSQRQFLCVWLIFRTL